MKKLSVKQMLAVKKSTMEELKLDELQTMWDMIASKINDSKLSESSRSKLVKKEEQLLKIVELKEKEIKATEKKKVAKAVVKKDNKKSTNKKKKSTTIKAQGTKKKVNKTEKKADKEIIGIAPNRYITFEEDGKDTKALILYYDVKTKELIVRAEKYDIIMFKALKSKIVNVFYDDGGKKVEGYSYPYTVTKS